MNSDSENEATSSEKPKKKKSKKSKKPKSDENTGNDLFDAESGSESSDSDSSVVDSSESDSEPAPTVRKAQRNIGKLLRESIQMRGHCFARTAPIRIKINKSNLVVLNKLFKIKFDLLTERIIIPIYDEIGTLVGIKGRSLDDNEENKYLYIYECPKNKILYGLYQN
jgi:hypothetical protein